MAVSKEDLIATVRRISDDIDSVSRDLNSLEDDIDSYEDEQADYSQSEERLRAAADLLAIAGFIHNIPHAKSVWINTGNGVLQRKA